MCFHLLILICSNFVLCVKAIVNEKGEMVTNLSASDMKLWLSHPKRQTLLSSNVIDFISEIRRRSFKTVHPYVHVEPSDLFTEAVNKLCATGFHHVFICRQRKPIAIISVRDCLRVFVNSTKSEYVQKTA